MLTDLKVAFRALSKQPGLSVVAILTLTLGIGANAAIYSLVKAVLLNPLPYDEGAALVSVSELKPEGEPDFVSPPTFVDLRERVASFEGMAAFRQVRYGFKGDDEPLDLPSLTATPSLFDVLGASARLGRTFTAEEAVPGADRVAVLSHGMWQRHFGGDRAVLGRRIELDAVGYTVVGVMGEEFTFPPGADVNLWTPLAFDPNDLPARSARPAPALGSLTGRVLLHSSRRAEWSPSPTRATTACRYSISTAIPPSCSVRRAPARGSSRRRPGLPWAEII